MSSSLIALVLHVAVKAVRRSGTVSVSGVYGGEVDPMPMMEMFDRGLQLRMGQAHVKRWIDDLMPMVSDGSDPLAVVSLATHHWPGSRAGLSLGEARPAQAGPHALAAPIRLAPPRCRPRCCSSRFPRAPVSRSRRALLVALRASHAIGFTEPKRSPHSQGTLGREEGAGKTRTRHPRPAWQPYAARSGKARVTAAVRLETFSRV